MATQRRSKRSVQPLPERIAPMLARAVIEPFDSEEHLFEIKWDGTRCVALVEAGRLRLQNRRYIEMRERYPELAGLSRLPAGTVVDGEIVVLEEGKPSFRRLQQREHRLDPRKIAMLSQRMPVTLMVFDLLYERGESVMRLPLEQRRQRLQDLVQELADPHVVLSDAIPTQGVKYFQAAEAHGLEGIMAKRLGSPYLPGKRSPHWLKIKVAQTETFDVLGFVQREGEPVVSALIVGMPYRGRWMYKAKVGSGFSEPQRHELYAGLEDAPPLKHPPRDGPAGAQWRDTGLRCRVRFFEKTATGRLRAPVFKGFVDE